MVQYQRKAYKKLEDLIVLWRLWSLALPVHRQRLPFDVVTNISNSNAPGPATAAPNIQSPHLRGWQQLLICFSSCIRPQLGWIAVIPLNPLTRDIFWVKGGKPYFTMNSFIISIQCSRSHDSFTSKPKNPASNTIKWLYLNCTNCR